MLFQSTRCWRVCQTRVADFAWVGREFLVRRGSRILRCLVGWKWLRRGIFIVWFRWRDAWKVRYEVCWVTDSLGWMYWCRGLTLERWRSECRLVEERFSLFRSFAEPPFL